MMLDCNPFTASMTAYSGDALSMLGTNSGRFGSTIPCLGFPHFSSFLREEVSSIQDLP